MYLMMLPTGTEVAVTTGPGLGFQWGFRCEAICLSVQSGGISHEMESTMNTLYRL